MTEGTLIDSYERCKNQETIMGDIADSLISAGMDPRVNSKQTEIVVDAEKKDIMSILNKKGLYTELFDFLIYMKEQKKKTYISLRYKSVLHLT